MVESQLRGAGQVTARQRALLGFAFGAIVMLAAVHIFTVNSFDFLNMQRGTRLLLTGVNPWAPDSRIPHFYNPPFAVLFLWPMLWTTPRLVLTIGGALVIAFAFHQRAWVALAWFATNTFLWLVAAGGIDMLVIGAGLLLLKISDETFPTRSSLVGRVLAYGLLMVKPQGGIFIVVLFWLIRRDWKGLVLSIVVYGLFFLPLYPDWLRVLITDPPRSQSEAAHTVYAKFGPTVAMVIALLVAFSRKWRYWQLSGALAGIVSPYGMPGLPIFLTLTAVRRWSAIPVVIIYSGLLATLTWVLPPPGVAYHAYLSPFMALYHLSMLGLAVVLAVFTAEADVGEERDCIAVGQWAKRVLTLTRAVR